MYLDLWVFFEKEGKHFICRNYSGLLITAWAYFLCLLTGLHCTFGQYVWERSTFVFPLSFWILGPEFRSCQLTLLNQVFKLCTYVSLNTLSEYRPLSKAFLPPSLLLNAAAEDERAREREDESVFGKRDVLPTDFALSLSFDSPLSASSICTYTEREREQW